MFVSFPPLSNMLKFSGYSYFIRDLISIGPHEGRPVVLGRSRLHTPYSFGEKFGWLRRKCFVAQGNLSTSTAKPFRTCGGKRSGQIKRDGRGCGGGGPPQLRAETQEARGTIHTHTNTRTLHICSLSLSPLRRAETKLNSLEATECLKL